MHNGAHILLAKRLAIVVFAMVGFGMTVYATARGATSFMTEWYAGYGVTVLAVGILVFTSFVFVGTISRSRPFYSSAILGLYLLAVFACWIFSFTSYHSQFLSKTGSDLAAAENDLSLLRSNLLPLQKEMEAKVSKSAADLFGDADFNSHLDSMTKLAGKMDDPQLKSNLANLLEEKAKERVEAERKQRDDAQAAKATAAATLESRQAELKEVSDSVSALTSAIAAAEQRKADLAKALAEEEGQTSTPGAPGTKLPKDGLASTLVASPYCAKERAPGKGKNNTGVCYQTLVGALEQTAISLTGLIGEKAAAEAKLQKLELAAGDAEMDLKNTVAKAEELAAIDAAAAPAAVADSPLRGLAETLKSKPSLAGFEEMAGACASAVTALQQLSPQEPAAVDCRPVNVVARFAALDEIQKARDAYMSACAGDEKPNAIVSGLRKELGVRGEAARASAVSKAFDTMTSQLINPCILAAEKAGVETAGIRSDVAGFLDRKNPSQDEISKAMGKIKELFNGTASARDYFPAFLALIQELSLLLSKLAWTGLRRREVDDIADIDLMPKAGDPGPVAAARNLLRLGSHDRDGMLLPRGFDAQGFPEDMRAQMGHIVGRLLRNGMARQSRRGFLIGAAGIADIVGLIRKRQNPLPVVEAADDNALSAADAAGVILSSAATMLQAASARRMADEQSPKPDAQTRNEVLAPDSPRTPRRPTVVRASR